jgi:phosphoribosylaminoimidazolecarboxamide formyltransferase/IMP cyclohydrolase
VHPKVGGILNQLKTIISDVREMGQFNIPQLDLVIVYILFEKKTVESGASDQAMVKDRYWWDFIDRAAAKNFKDTPCVSSMEDC